MIFFFTKGINSSNLYYINVFQVIPMLELTSAFKNMFVYIKLYYVSYLLFYNLIWSAPFLFLMLKINILIIHIFNHEKVMLFW